MTTGETDSHGAVLRPLIARLKEIERKCDAMGSRNEEFPLMKERLVSIIARLEAGQEPSGEPLAYRAMARELFPVAHLFESVGFMSVGKEIAHVERSLENLEPEPAGPARSPSSMRSSPISSAAVQPPASTGEEEGIDETPPKGISDKGMPKPVLGALLVLVLALAIATTIVLKVRSRSEVPDAVPQPTPPVAPPSPSPVTRPTPSQPDPDSAVSTGERLADALDQARQSIDGGDIDGAIGYLAFAELIDRNDPRVAQVADRIVVQLVSEANQAAGEERWDDATRLTADARAVAKRFGRDTETISEAERVHAEMRRFRVVAPDQIQILRASIGKHVEVALDDGSVFAGWLRGFRGSNMILDVEDDVGGGIVSFTDEIPLHTIDWVRIRED